MGRLRRDEFTSRGCGRVVDLASAQTTIGAPTLFVFDDRVIILPHPNTTQAHCLPPTGQSCNDEDSGHLACFMLMFLESF